MRRITNLIACSLLGLAWLCGCSPTPLKTERHELRPVAREFSVAAPALTQAMGVLGMQVAQQSAGPETITVSAVTPEGVRVEITLRASGSSSSTLDVQSESEQLAVAQLASRLAEALADQLAQSEADARNADLMQLGYIGYVGSESEPAEPSR